jgi:quercetin dioxygenase-like cupin family protein
MDTKSYIVLNNKENYISHSTFKNVEIYPFLSPDMNLGIRSQYAKLKPEGEISPHTHDVVEVFTVIKGKPHILISGNWVQVEEGATLVAYPGEVHGVKNNTEEEVVIVCNFKC